MEHPTHSHHGSPMVSRHLLWLVIVIAIIGGLYLLTQQSTSVTLNGLAQIVIVIVVAIGIILLMRVFFSKLIQQVHGVSTGHSHTHPDLETEGITISGARFYDALVRFILPGQYQKIIQSMIVMARIQPGEKVLDIGCGTGTLAIAARQQAPATAEILGLDASPEMIERARQKAQAAGVDVNFQTGLAEAIHVPDNTFDLVMNSMMVHHLPGDLKARAFAEMYRVLKPGGRLLIVDFEPPTNPIIRFFLSIFLGQGMMVIENKIVPPLLDKVGFKNIKIGQTGSRLATSIAAIKPAQ